MPRAALRNPVRDGLESAVTTQTLWTVVNERDLLGDDLVPDYFTHVQRNGFYGWPYRYHGSYIDDRVKEPAPAEAEQSIVPDVDLAAHSASLGLTFYTAKTFPEHYRGGAFIAQHGSCGTDLRFRDIALYSFPSGMENQAARRKIS